MVSHFWNKFRIHSAQKARHLKNRSFERIYVQNWILEGWVQILKLLSVTLCERIYIAFCSKKCTFEKCTFWRNLHWKLWFNEVSHGRPAGQPFPNFFCIVVWCIHWEKLFSFGSGGKFPSLILLISDDVLLSTKLLGTFLCPAVVVLDLSEKVPV